MTKRENSDKLYSSLDACFVINKLPFPRCKKSGEADFSFWDSGCLEEHLVMEMTGKQLCTPTGNNCTGIHKRTQIYKEHLITVSPRLNVSGSN